MAKRTGRQSSAKKSGRIANSDSLKALEQQVIAIAEQLGHIVGAAQAKADTWLDQPDFHAQLTRIRERASELLGRLGVRASNVDDNGRAKARARSRAKVAAPGKKHRQAPESVPAPKDLARPIVSAGRRRGNARPRQG